MKKAIKLIIAIIICELAGVIGSFFTAPAIKGWYVNLARPEFAPPNWVFAPVWTTLFALMGIALFLIWKKGLNRHEVKIALAIFFVQLILNILWSIIFFGFQSPFGAVIEIVILWLAILATIIAFHRISKAAAWLLVPYILWVSFAGFLNYSIWQLNAGSTSGQTACTMEAKLCPDGTAVGRTGPNCDFAPCPTDENNDLWQTTTDDKAGITFQYPTDLLTTYIHTVDWPPKVQVLYEAFTCTEAGTETARAGKTEQRLVDDRTYCVTTESEGAAGSIYTNYAYAFPLYSTGSTQADRKVIIFTFSLRAVQCANYDEPQKTDCEKEREAFDLDSIIDRMARSITVK